MTKFGKIWQTLGPGFLYAGAAVGVSHLVQSTSAGARYGFLLIGVILLSNFFKYPFFEAGPRYAAATGLSLIDGYKKIGKWAVWLFAFLSLSTAFTIQATVTAVTAVLLNNILGISSNTVYSSAFLLALCALLLLKGKYKLLDNVIKYVVILLSIASVFALFKASTLPINKSMWPQWEFNTESFIFLLALLGWMPAPLDISVWHSIWTIEKKRKNAGHFSVKQALRDFHIGYWGTALLAVIFLCLGALVLFGNNLMFEKSAANFAQQFISLYTHTLGKWTYPIIAFAAFATMFSTTITVLDGAPRVFNQLFEDLFGPQIVKEKTIYTLSIFIIAGGALLIIGLLFQSLATLITIATVASFLTAPVLAYLNYKLMFGKHLPPENQPNTFNRVVSIIGIFLLSGFSIIYFLHLLNILKLG